MLFMILQGRMLENIMAIGEMYAKPLKVNMAHVPQRNVQNDWRSAVLYIASPIIIHNETIGVLTVCKSTKTINQFITRTRNKILILGSVIIGFLFLLGILVNRWITTPINALLKYTKEISTNNKTDMPELGDQQLNHLALALHDLRHDLDGKNYIERYTKHLTHELKSPISAIFATAELLNKDMDPQQYAKFIKNIKNESQRMKVALEKLLQLATLENLDFLQQKKKHDLVELTKNKIEYFKLHNKSKHITWNFHINKHPAIIEGDELLLDIVFENLMQNAKRFSSNNGIIKISINSKVDVVYWTIEDNGSGVPEYATHRIFERFYSLPDQMTGLKSSGLGLSLVKEIIDLHHGTIDLDLNLKQGARFIITFPI